MDYDITLIFPSSPFLINQNVFPPLGILYLAGRLKEFGYKVQCLDLGIGHTKEMAVAPVIGISFTTPQRFEAYELCKYYKKLGKIVIAGGIHPTHMWKECLKKGFDKVVCGESDYGIIGILSDTKKGIVGGNYIECLPVTKEHIGIPDRDALPIQNYNYKINNEPATVIMTSRGCPYNCSFCAKITKDVRLKDADEVSYEILSINEKYGFRAFMIFDDIFTLDKQRLLKIAQTMKPEGFLFRCFSRANLISEEICESLVNMGVVEVGIGVESGSNHILKQNMKGTTTEINSKAFEILKDYNIRAKAFLIVGLPGETEGTIIETRKWIEENRPDDLDISILQPMPGSFLFEKKEVMDLSFSYNGNPMWYKGTPGKYKTNISTKGLSSERLLTIRDELERDYKNKELLK